ncbi:hypothetical protein ACFWP5_21425 [Streptomyces sp. NPDC058469]|uniref:hypothetical protein n=1 Tax=Streptomyces sp. NPDC058469 TaxID=3346514 RepID=UPI00364778E0
MQGHGYPQPAKPPPPTGALVVLRVLFVGISVFSIGFLAWTMLLRLAIVTRKSLDWGLLVAAAAADVLSIVLLGSEPGEEVHTTGGYLGITLLLGTLMASVVYYLAADIRHFQKLRQGGYGGQRPPAAAYGYPQSSQPDRPPSPYTATTTPQHTPPPIPHTPVPQQHTPPPMPHTPVPQQHTPPPGQRPAPARIDQVRAELDELSDYLRKHDEGGR